jgi:CRP-like cAMP-binding protein
MPLTPDQFQTTQACSIFRGLESTDVQAAVDAARVQTLEDGAFFFMEEEPAEHAFVLIEGKVKLAQLTPDGQQVILGYIVPGRVFGIIAILKKTTYPVSAQTVGQSQALVWDQHTLLHLLNEYPRIALNALNIMAGQIRQFQNQVRELATQRVEQRIARAVVRLASQAGRKVDEGIRIELPLSRQDLAEMTGTTLYTVSRVLTDWEKRGLVQSKRQQILIRSPHGLMTIAEDLPIRGEG